jgi:hypothetical protein
MSDAAWYGDGAMPITTVSPYMPNKTYHMGTGWNLFKERIDVSNQRLLHLFIITHNLYYHLINNVLY